MLGLDVGTSFIISAKETAGGIEYTDFRDAFYVIKPTNPIATKMIEKGLAGKVFIKDEETNSFILLGKDAIEKAIERNDTAKRPMYRGVVSAKEKDAKKVLAFILKEVVGEASEPGEKLVFCRPAQPVDQEDEDFDEENCEEEENCTDEECEFNDAVETIRSNNEENNTENNTRQKCDRPVKPGRRTINVTLCVQ